MRLEHYDNNATGSLLFDLLTPANNSTEDDYQNKLYQKKKKRKYGRQL
jgi:hypothetical protein